MSDISSIDSKNERKLAALLEKRKEILSAPPEKALEMILSSELPAALVQSFSEQDLYFLTHDIGISDALPVLALATSDQWGYMLDVETWERDQMDLDSVTRWFRALLLADGRRLVNWLLVERLEFLELYLFKNIQVIVRDEMQDPSEIPDDYFTVDDYFYVKIKEKPETLPVRDDDEMVDQEDLDLVVREILEKMLAVDHGLYVNVMLESMGVIGAEAEEENLRLRNVRLAEKGFLPFDEALEVFSPIHAGQMEDMVVRREKKKFEDEEKETFPLAHLSEVRGTNLFTRALAEISGMADLGEFEMEFAALCNQIISAEQIVIRDKGALSKIVKKAVCYISIGLEILEGRKDDKIQDAGAFLASLIMRHSVKNLFRLGIGRITDVKHRAERLRRDGWFTGRKLPLSFWGEAYVGVLGGLLVKRPVFYHPVSQGTIYREFECLEDIEKTEKVLDEIKYFDDLLSLVNPRMEAFKEFFPTYANVLLTLWAHARSGRGETTEGPVPLDDFRSFFMGLWNPGPKDVALGGVINDGRKRDFLDFLAVRSGFSETEISERLGGVLEDLFTEIGREYGAVAEKDLDPRFLTHFCVVK
jgi:hypothetical protein